MTKPTFTPEQIDEMADQSSSWFTPAGSTSPERILDHRAFAQVLLSAIEQAAPATASPDTVTVPRVALEYVLKGAEDTRAYHLPDLVTIRRALAAPVQVREPDGWIVTNILLSKQLSKKDLYTTIYLRSDSYDVEAVDVLSRQEHRGQPVYAIDPFYFDHAGTVAPASNPIDAAAKELLNAAQDLVCTSREVGGESHVISGASELARLRAAINAVTHARKS